jgi:Na+-transporting NADH:ubiquinone oxidoreductase subunit D
MGRAEGYAMQNGPWRSLLDGVGNGLGYSLILMGTALLREFLGSWSIFGVQLVSKETITPNGLMLIAPGAFFIIGLFIWGLRTWKPDQVETEG